MSSLIISCANVKHTGKQGTTYKTATLVQDFIKNSFLEESSIASLAELNLTSCIMCGNCLKTENCSFDPDFNQLYAQILAADKLIFIVPHYAALPSKLMILLEKLQEFYFVNASLIPDYKFPLIAKKCAIIAHGGAEWQYEKLYFNNLVNPLSRILRSSGFDVIELSTEERGAVFCVEGYHEQPEKLPEMIIDWDMVKNRVQPLLEKLYS